MGSQSSRLSDVERAPLIDKAITDDFAHIRETYETPKHTIVLAHGLLGFSEMNLLPGHYGNIHYWRGITEAMRANGIRVITTTVPASGTIEERAEKLLSDIRRKIQRLDLVQGYCEEYQGTKAKKDTYCKVNIIAHSMGGLDARYMISNLLSSQATSSEYTSDKPVPDLGAKIKVRSLTTIATPHRGSPYADWLINGIGPGHIRRIYAFLNHLGMQTGAFMQLTTQYMTEKFNPATPNVKGVRYFSYGADLAPDGWWGIFKAIGSWHIIRSREGANDGLVSVESSRWGVYKGTIMGVNHLDLINWTNRMKWWIKLTLWGKKPKFNAVAFYLDIADMLAKEGL